MLGLFKSNEQALRQILDRNAQFTIPIFQRGYEWEWGTEKNPGQAKQLFEDIQNSSIKQLGFIILHDADGKRRIIDGQQRLITCSLFLKAVLEVIRNNNWEDIEDGDLETHIQEALKTGKKNQKILPEYKYSSFNSYIQIMDNVTVLDRNNNFFNNYYQAHKALTKLGKDSIDNFANTLLEVPMLEISLSDESTAMNIFMTFNSKGKPLQDADFYKDELFLAFPKSDEKDKLFSSTWDELCKKSRLAFKQSASDDSKAMKPLFEFYHKVLPAKEGWDSKGGKDREFFSRDNFECFKDSKCALSNLKNICNSLIIYKKSAKLICGRGEVEDRVNNLFATILQTKNVALLEAMYVYLFSTPSTKDIEIFTRGLLSIYLLIVAINISDTDAKTLSTICCDIIRQIYGLKVEEDKIPILAETLAGSKSTFPDLISNMQYKYKASTNTALKITLLFNTIVGTNQAQIENMDKLDLDHIFPKDEECRSDKDLEDEELTKLMNGLGNLTLLKDIGNRGKNNNSDSQKGSKVYSKSDIFDTLLVGGQLKEKAREEHSWDKESMQNRLHELSLRLFKELSEGMKEFIELQNRHFGFSEEQQKLYKSLADEFPAPHFPYNKCIENHVIESLILNTLPGQNFKLFNSLQFLDLSLTGEDKFGKEVDKEFSDADVTQVYIKCVNFLLSNYWKELKDEISLKESLINKDFRSYKNNEGTFYYNTKLNSASRIEKIAKMCKIVGIKAIVNCIL